jgi:hypothetical protein
VGFVWICVSWISGCGSCVLLCLMESLGVLKALVFSIC